MNAARAMNPDIEALCDPDRTLHETTRRYADAATNHQNDVTDVFDRALRTKMALDMLEEKASIHPSTEILACYMNGEYQLLKLYDATPLRRNPFLSHWVEAVQRLIPKQGQGKVNCTESEIFTKSGIAMVRALWIRALLLGTFNDVDTRRTPLELARSLIKNGDWSKPFNLRPFIQILEEEGIYEARQEDEHRPAEPGSSSIIQSGAKVNHHSTSRNESNEALPLTTVEQLRIDMPQKLKDDLQGATFELTRLPVELSSLDYLNTLLTDRVLEAHSVDPAPVVTQYIQHALRTIEHMERPIAHLDHPPDMSVHDEHDLQYGKEAQGRAVRLLLLFIKSLIRKELMAADVLYFEIQEICVRYVWIREVREFRTWVEAGVGNDGGS